MSTAATASVALDADLIEELDKLSAPSVTARWIRTVLSDPTAREDGRWGKARARRQLADLRRMAAVQAARRAADEIKLRRLRAMVLHLSVRVACEGRGRRHGRVARAGRTHGARPVRLRGGRRSGASRGDPDLGDEPPGVAGAPTGGRR
jgi:hypothetical protein